MIAVGSGLIASIKWLPTATVKDLMRDLVLCVFGFTLCIAGIFAPCKRALLGAAIAFCIGGGLAAYVAWVFLVGTSA